MRELEYGDVISVSREKGLYNHFGIYSGGGDVIHYVDGEIKETSLKRFLDGSKVCSIYLFNDSGKRTDKISYDISPIAGIGTGILSAKPGENIFKVIDKHIQREISRTLYSPEETVARAREKIGTRKYGLFGHNCEHFAIWCKTGVKESEQSDLIDDVIDIFLGTADNYDATDF